VYGVGEDVRGALRDRRANQEERGTEAYEASQVEQVAMVEARPVDERVTVGLNVGTSDSRDDINGEPLN
jgi:hypothetical protein